MFQLQKSSEKWIFFPLFSNLNLDRLNLEAYQETLLQRKSH